MKRICFEMMIVALFFVKVLCSSYNAFAVEQIDYYSTEEINYKEYSNTTLQNRNEAVSNNSITAEQFFANMTVGWNLGNALDCGIYDKSRGYDLHLDQETKWGNPVISKELIDYIASRGINTIRVPVTWYYNTGIDENGRLLVGEKWLARVAEVVDYALDNNMYVIIDSHHDSSMFYVGVSEEEFTLVKNRTRELWTQVGNYFKEYDSRLMFEAFNEIDNKEAPWQFREKASNQLNQLNQVFVDTIRATGCNNRTRNLILPTLFHRCKDTRIFDSFVMPQDFEKNHIIVAVHGYSSVLGQDLEGMMGKIENFSTNIGAPVIITEIGTTSKSSLQEYRIINAANYIARAKKHGIKCVWWDNGKEYAIVNRKNPIETEHYLIDSLLIGYSGYAFESSEYSEYALIDDYVYARPNCSTGEIKYTHWGALTTKQDFPVVGGEKYAISLIAENEACDMWITDTAFYDANGKFIQCKNTKVTEEVIITAPEGASKMRVTILNPYRDVPLEEYMQYTLDGDMRLIVSHCSFECLSMVKLQ